MKCAVVACALVSASISVGAHAAESEAKGEFQVNSVVDEILTLKPKTGEFANLKVTLDHSPATGFGDQTTDVVVKTNIRHLDLLIKKTEPLFLVGKNAAEQYPVDIQIVQGTEANSKFVDINAAGVMLTQQRLGISRTNHTSGDLTLKLVGAKSDEAKFAGADTYSGTAKIAVTPTAKSAF